jgi:DNA ligase (NAD+)
VAAVLAQHFPAIQQMQRASVEQLSEINEIGPIIAESVHSFLHDQYGQAIIEDLRLVGVEMDTAQPRAAASEALQGKTVVATGTLDKYTRDEIKRLVEQHGGRMASSVSNKTDYVLAGENAGSKLTKARQLEIKVISEEDFEQLIAE